MKNSSLRYALVVLALSALIQGCSSATVRVMPGEDGIIHVKAKDARKEVAEEAAVDKANDYCHDRKKEPVFIKDSSKYNGSMDESTRENVRKASDVAFVLGGFGTPVGQAGQAGHMWTSGQDYEAEVQFRCQ